MKNIFTGIIALAVACPVSAAVITSPSGNLKVVVDTLSGGVPCYSVEIDGLEFIEPSPLGLETNEYNLASKLSPGQITTETVDINFDQDRIKKNRVQWKAVKAVTPFRSSDGRALDIEWYVGDNDIAFRYVIPRQGERASLIVTGERTSYRFPESSTVFATPQSDAMIGWKRTKPSYEEYYITDAPLDTVSQYGHGYTWPALFRIGDNGWVLLGETGVDGYYCASHLSDYADGLYSVAYPMPEENNGNGSANPGIAVPGATPWRTITVGRTLQPIVETTIPWAVVSPRYELANPARPGKGTWSWLLWQDGSINFDDQKTFVDLAADMGYQNVLIDNWWDRNIGRERIRELIDYAASKGINVILWYSSSGHWNDIEQSPVNHMDRPIVRKKEMKWLRDNGVKAIKVDFFGGDKQETMRLYEDILSDAADYGIDVVFHGCTLPRGWERMYPNFVGAEAVLASENLVFGQEFCDLEAFHATLHPFIRNSLACMEYGGTILNKHFSRDNQGGTVRRTGDAFQLATSVLFQNPVQNFALAPNNLTDAPAEAIEFLKEVPTTWTDTEFIDGYPGRYVILARTSGNKKYIAGVNATDRPVEIDSSTLGLGTDSQMYIDTKKGFSHEIIKNGKNYKISIWPQGGFVIVTNL